VIDLVILDQGGLVTRGDFDIVPAAAARLGVGAAELRVFLAPDLPAFMRGELGPGELWSRLAERAGLRAAEDYFATLFRPRLDLPTFDLVRRLAAAGHRVVSGTNTIESHYRLLEAEGHFAAYHAVYASHLIGLCKPDPGFWEYILRREGVDASLAFFADDSAENVEAAAALGIQARLFTEAPRLEADLAALGVSLPAVQESAR
jgi:putative hydrolase of the HAD superfamily